jgi:Uma2 family endonuclease
MSTSKQLVSPDDYDRMIATGQLTENDRVELIRGEIIEKMAIGPSHSSRVKWFVKHLGPLLGDAAIIGAQDPVRLDDSEPEPDISIVRPRDDLYATGHPRSDDIFLLVEVADSSLEFDRDVKGSMYADAGIREYWIVNLIDDCIEIHRDPRGGVYRDVRTVARDETSNLLAFPQIVLKGNEILG